MKLTALWFALLLACVYAAAGHGTGSEDVDVPVSLDDDLPTLQELLPRPDDGSEDIVAVDSPVNLEKLDNEANDPFFFLFRRRRHRRRRQRRQRNHRRNTGKYVDVGCWRDSGSRAIPTLEGKDGRLRGSYTRRRNAVYKCYLAAKARGFQYFALQNGGWCASSRNARNTYRRYGKSGACKGNGRGGPWANRVYRMKVGMRRPVVTAGTNGERIRFTSIQRMSHNRPSRFEVRWYCNRKIVKTETVTTVSYLENTDSKRYFSLGYHIYTKVRGWYSNSPNAKSRWVTSNKYFAGFQFQPTSLSLSEGGSSMVLEVIATIPITVPVVYVRLLPSRPDVLLSECTVEFTSTGKTRTVRKIGVAAKPDFVDRNNNLKISEKIIFDRLEQQQAPNNDWENIRVTTVGVQTKSKATGRCTSSGDPHMKTFDGITYNHYQIGEYVLAESKIRKWSVHTRTHRCARVSCNCGVAAREGQDVLVVDMCRRPNAPVAFYKTTQEPRHGTYIERSHNGKKFILKFKSGASVTFEVKIWRHRGRNIYYADVTVQSAPADYGQTRGLCGNINRNRRDDMVARGGRRGRSCGRMACASYTESWKITNRAESNFYYESKKSGCLPKVGSKLCLCSVRGEKEDNCNVEFSPPKFPRKPSASGGYKILGFPGRAKCDRQRKVITHRGKVIELPPTSKEEEKYVFKPPTNFMPHIPSFPTKSGISKRQASRYCINRIKRSALYRACKRAIRVKFNIHGFLRSCVSDIQILDDKVAAVRSAFDSMKSDCEEVLLRTPSLWKPGPNGKLAPPSNVGNGMCPAQCSGNGRCVKGACICKPRFITEDCSVQLGVKPELVLTGYPTGGYRCNIKGGNCNTVKIFSEHLVPDRVVCGFTSRTGGLTKVPAQLLSFSEVLCTIPKTTTGITYSVSLSNDGTSWSTSHISYTIYDPSNPEPKPNPTQKPTAKPAPAGWTTVEDCRVMCGGTGGYCPDFCGVSGYCCNAVGNECPAEVSSQMTGNVYSCSSAHNAIPAGNTGVHHSGNNYGGWVVVD